jgi:uncharacterized protein
VSRLNLAAACFGAAFGFLFSAAGFNQYDIVHRTLLLQYLDPFYVMGSAVATAMPILWVLERRGLRTPLGGALALRRWPLERKHLYGGVVFGTGWAITGACPGTVAAMLAAGSLLGLVPLAGIIAGIFLRDAIAERQTAIRDEPVTEPAAATGRV